MQSSLCYAIVVTGIVFGSIQQNAIGAELSQDLAKAVSDDPQVAEEAIAHLRSGGRKTFEELLALRDRLSRDASLEPNVSVSQMNEVIDQVGAARYSSVSGLYWHTDLQKAIAEAKANKKPILSLRMMGQLTEEYSCANSRFFRTTLYANRAISKCLKENFVLHWKSVRPVPKVTIDFGDGRKLERTLTGNSIHYILAPDARVIDGLPGLYSPQQFLSWLQRLQSVGNIYDKDSEAELVEALKFWHLNRAASISRRWQSDLRRVAEKFPEATAQAPADPQTNSNPPAEEAAAVAITKSLGELPVIANVIRDTRNLEARTPDKTWLHIAELYRENVQLDRASIDLIRSENPVISSDTSTEKRENSDPILRIVSEFEKAIAVDTVRNEYLLHSKLHSWFAEGTAPEDLEELNEMVYEKLFLTPRQDPWIGLVPPDVYTGLTNGGVVSPK